MHSEKVMRNMALLPQGEGQETLNVNLVGHRRDKAPQVGPSDYYMKPMRPQVQIPKNNISSTHPRQTVIDPHNLSLLQQARPSPQSPPTTTNTTTTTNEDFEPGMVWNQSTLQPSSTSEPLYSNIQSCQGRVSNMMTGNRNLSNQMFSMMATPFPVEDVSYDHHSGNMRTTPFMSSYETMSGTPYGNLDGNMSLLPSSQQEINPMYSYFGSNGVEWSHASQLDQSMGNLHLHKQASRSSLHPSDSPSDMGAVPYTGQYDDHYPSESPSSDPALNDDELPPYAELIYEALRSAPGHQMHLQEIYQWFRDNYSKFRNDDGKGWMNSIRHNLSMNGAFVKVERPASEPGKGYMWLLAPAALQNGIKSTTRYRKSGPAKNRSHKDHADQSYNDYVTPKRHRQGKRIQTKARRIAKKNLQKMQQVDQQQPQDYTDSFGMDYPPAMTPDFSPLPSDTFSETLSSSSRHATPAVRNTEFQSPTTTTRHVSPYYGHGDEYSFDNTPLSNYGYGKPVTSDDYL